MCFFYFWFQIGQNFHRLFDFSFGCVPFEIQFHYRCAVAEDPTKRQQRNVQNRKCIISHGVESFKRNAMCD